MPLWSTSLGQHNPSSTVWQSCVHCLPKTTKTFTFSETRSAVSIYRTEMDWIGCSEGWVGSTWFGPPPSDVATVYNRWHIIWKELGVALVVAAPFCVRQWDRRGCRGCWRLESDWGTFIMRNNLHHSIPLPVGWRGQDGARFQRKLGHVFRVFSYCRPYVSVLLVEELGIRGTSLGTIRGRLVRWFGRQTVLPVFWVVKGHLQLLPSGFTWCLSSSVLQHAGWVCGGMDLVGWQAAVPNGGWRGQDTWLAHLGLGSSSCLALAGRATTWVDRLSCRFDGVMGVEKVSWWTVVAGHARWRRLGCGEGVVGQAGLDSKREVGSWGCDWDGRRWLGGKGQTISPQDLQAQLGRAVEGVEVEGLIDVLILSFGLAVWCAVVARVVQGMDLTIFMSWDKWVLLNWVQVFFSSKSEKGRQGRDVENKREEVYEKIRETNNIFTEIRSGIEKTKEMEIVREYEKEITR